MPLESAEVSGSSRCCEAPAALAAGAPRALCLPQAPAEGGCCAALAELASRVGMGSFAFYLLQLSLSWCHAADGMPVGAHPSVSREMEPAKSVFPALAQSVTSQERSAVQFGSFLSGSATRACETIPAISFQEFRCLKNNTTALWAASSAPAEAAASVHG